MTHVAALLVCLAWAGAAAAQVPPSLQGDWDGELTVPAGLKVPLTLHVGATASTMDSPDQGVKGVAVQVTAPPGGLEVDTPSAHSRFAGVLSADGRVVSGPLTQGAMTLQARFVQRTAGAAAPVRERPQTPRPPFPYDVQEVRIPSADGVALAGTLTRPRSAARTGAVVMVAGSGPQTRDETVAGHEIFAVIGDRLTRAGVAVLRYDKRGVGASTGSYTRATTADFATDAQAAFSWLRAQPGVDPTKVGMLGHSEGAEIAPTVAVRDQKVTFLVLLSTPALPGVETIVSQGRAVALVGGVPLTKADADAAKERRLLDVIRTAPDEASAQAAAERILVGYGHTPAQAVGEARTMASPWYRAFLDDDPAPTIARLRLPVLVVAGSKDLQVLPYDNLPVIRRTLAADRQATIVELPGLNHLLQPARTGAPSEYGTIDTSVDPSALDLIARWVSERAGAYAATP